MKYTIKDFYDICKHRFQFIESYGFSLYRKSSEEWGHVIDFRNQTTGILVKFEFRDFRISLDACRLINGEIVPDDGEITPDSVLNNYDFDNVVWINNPEKVFPRHRLKTKFDKELIEKMVLHEAKNLEDFGKSILNGDFSIFDKLEVVVKERAREAAFQKWGSRAIEFGWKQ